MWVSCCPRGGEVVSGIALVVVSVASVLIPCVDAENAIVSWLSTYYSAATSATVSVSPEGGCALAALAMVVQVVPVAARIIKVGSRMPYERPGREQPSPEDNKGDLPIR